MAAISYLDMEKTCYGEFFTNRYIVNFLPSDGSAASNVVALQNVEKAALYDIVEFTTARISTIAPNDEQYRTFTLVGTGSRSTPEDGVLPLFNVARIDLLATAGRPSRKYLRGCLAEQDIDHNFIIDATITGILQPYGQGVTLLDWIVDPQGDDLVLAQVQPRVGMRQLRRGTRRRTESVL